MARTLVELAGLPTVASCNGMDPEPSTHCLHGQSYASAFGVGSAPKRDFAIMQWPCEHSPRTVSKTRARIPALPLRVLTDGDYASPKPPATKTPLVGRGTMAYALRNRRWRCAHRDLPPPFSTNSYGR